jgi:hypothetical protein
LVIPRPPKEAALKPGPMDPDFYYPALKIFFKRPLFVNQRTPHMSSG